MLVRFANCLSVLDASGDGESMSLFAWVAVLHKLAEEAGIKIEGLDQTEADLSKTLTRARELAQGESAGRADDENGFCRYREFHGAKIDFMQPDWNATVLCRPLI